MWNIIHGPACFNAKSEHSSHPIDAVIPTAPRLRWRPVGNLYRRYANRAFLALTTKSSNEGGGI